MDMPAFPKAELDDAVVADIEARLEAALGGDPASAEVNEAIPTQEPVVTDDAASDEPVAEKAADADPAPDAESDPAEELPTLSDNVQRAMLGSKWTEEEIKQGFDVYGVDEMNKIADKVYQNHKDNSREWAAHGRMVTDSEAATQPQVTDDSKPNDQLPRIDADALKEEYAHDEAIAQLIDKMAGPMNLSIEAINKILPSIAESKARHQQSEDAVLKQEIDGFFNGRDLAGFSKHYGEGSTESTVDTDAYGNRMKVLQYADQLRVGATYQGRDISLQDALYLAHDAVSGDWKMEAMREDLKTQLQKRAKSVTLKPAESSTSTTSGEAEVSEKPTRKQLEDTSLLALRELFNQG
jgi:hypothetical protein